MEFFRGQHWKEHGINLSRVGIDALKSFLQTLLEGHIERELPKVCSEISSLLKRTQAELHGLGEERSTTGDQRIFLSKVCMEIQGIMQSALDGSYQNPSSTMQPKIYKSTRGKELPGNYSNALLTELFHEQSSRWPAIAERHVNRIQAETASCVELALEHVIHDDHVRHEMLKTVNHRLQDALSDALKELQKLCGDDKLQPITYNHYYTDNIQRSRLDGTRSAIRKALKGASTDLQGVLHVSNTDVDRQRLLDSLERHVNVDMDKQACEEAKAGLVAYYKVAMKTFVDNVCRQVVERHIACNARVILTPTYALKISDDEVSRIASETQTKLNGRKDLKVLEKALQESLFELSM